MSNVFKTRTFWTALATGITGIMTAYGLAPPVTEAATWLFGTLTAIFLRAGVLKNNTR